CHIAIECQSFFPIRSGAGKFLVQSCFHHVRPNARGINQGILKAIKGVLSASDRNGRYYAGGEKGFGGDYGQVVHLPGLYHVFTYNFCRACRGAIQFFYSDVCRFGSQQHKTGVQDRRADGTKLEKGRCTREKTPVRVVRDKFLVNVISRLKSGHGDGGLLGGEFRFNCASIGLDSAEFKKIRAAGQNDLSVAADGLAIKQADYLMRVERRRAVNPDFENAFGEQDSRRTSSQTLIAGGITNNLYAVLAIRRIKRGVRDEVPGAQAVAIKNSSRIFG